VTRSGTEGDDTQLTVLVVEDEAAHQMLIRKALVRDDSPFSLVQFARDSQEAVRFAHQIAFDVLLVDNRIPGTRGLDLLTELRETGVTAPFVLMTSAGSEELVVQAYRKKVDDYVIKDSGFWRDLPRILLRVVDAERARRREVELVERLGRANAKLDRLNTEHQLRISRLRGRLEELRAAVSALGSPAGDPLAAILDGIDGCLEDDGDEGEGGARV